MRSIVHYNGRYYSKGRTVQYSKSAEIYVNAPYLTMKEKEQTGRSSRDYSFHLVRHYRIIGHSLGEDRRGQSAD